MVLLSLFCHTPIVRVEFVTCFYTYVASTLIQMDNFHVKYANTCFVVMSIVYIIYDNCIIY